MSKPQTKTSRFIQVLNGNADVLAIAKQYQKKYKVADILTAGIVALTFLSPEDREKAFDEATGAVIEYPNRQAQKEIPDENLIIWSAIKKIMAESSKSNAQIYRRLTKDESAALEKLRQSLGPDSCKTVKARRHA